MTKERDRYNRENGRPRAGDTAPGALCPSPSPCPRPVGRRAIPWRAPGAWCVVPLLVALAAPPALSQATARTPARPAPAAGDTSFAATVARLSEPAGYFDTDNLISNESSYLHVVPRLQALGVQGGAYVGVGPDQSYSYIAAIRPRIAFMIDVRRDNALQHLMYKGLFARSRNRMEFLCRWLGRPVPRDIEQWTDRPITAIVDWLDRTGVDHRAVAEEQHAIVQGAARTGVPLDDNDRATLVRFHAAFVREGLGLRFTSFGRAPRPHYPTLRQLVLERDAAGEMRSYLARESDWRFVKELHDRDRIVPVVGNLAGTGAFPALARELQRRGEHLSALYTSNVEFYLWQDGSFERFAANVAAFPRTPQAVIIRSYFGRQFGDAHPLAAPGHNSAQLLQSVDDFVTRWRAGGWRSYSDLVRLGAR